MSENVEKIEKDNTEMKEVFLFEIDGGLYAVSVEHIERVMKIPPVTPIPNAPRTIVGIFHLHGKVVVVMDIIRRMEIPKQKPLTANYLFVVRHRKEYFGILVDKPKMMVRIPSSEIYAPNSIITAHVPAQYILGVFLHQEHIAVAKKASILISVENKNKDEGEPTQPPLPVLLLNLENLLNQEDLMALFASQK